MFTAEEIDLISKALIKNELLNKSKQSDLYYSMRKSLKNNKQVKTELLVKLCLKLIRDKSTLNPINKDTYSEEFQQIINSYPGESYQDIMCKMKRNWHCARDNLKAQNELRYEYQQKVIELQEKVDTMNSQISSLESHIRILKKPDNADDIYN